MLNALLLLLLMLSKEERLELNTQLMHHVRTLTLLFSFQTGKDFMLEYLMDMQDGKLQIKLHDTFIKFLMRKFNQKIQSKL